MNWSVPQLPRGRWKRVVGGTLAITTLVTSVAVAGSYYGAELLNGGATWGDIVIAVFLCLILTPPICAYLITKVEELHLANQRLHIYATTDSLTGTQSRGAFIAEVERRLELPTNQHTALGSLLVIDVDKFKQINDSFGHQQGDLALRLISAAIRSHVRGFDRVGRLGGEEFGVFLVDAAPEYALVAAERIRRAITEIEFAPDVSPTHLSISIGVTTAMQKTSFADLYHRADMNLYKAKSQGRNQVVIEDWQKALPPKPVPAPISSVA